MIDCSIAGIRFLRTVCRQPTREYLEGLRGTYDYVYVAAYQKVTADGYSVLAKVTPVIRLDVPLETILGSFNATTRNEIRASRKLEGLEIVALDDNADDIYRVHADFERAQHRTPLCADELRQSLVFSAYYRQRLVALIGCFANDGILRVAQICSVRMEEDEPDLLRRRVVAYATRALVFAACSYGAGSGYTLLDLGVVNLTDPQKTGISKFKMSFRGQIVDTYIYRYETSRFHEAQQTLRQVHGVHIH